MPKVTLGTASQKMRRSLTTESRGGAIFSRVVRCLLFIPSQERIKGTGADGFGNLPWLHGKALSWFAPYLIPLSKIIGRGTVELRDGPAMSGRFAVKPTFFFYPQHLYAIIPHTGTGTPR